MKDATSVNLPDGSTANPDYNASYAGDPTYLEDKFARLSYRFKFEDGEYSIVAPFFGFLLSQTEEIQLKIPSLLSPQPIEGPQLTIQSNFRTLRRRNSRGGICRSYRDQGEYCL